MDKLRAYLNSLATSEQQAFALRCGTSIGYLRKAISNAETLREKLCALIETNSHGAVTRRDLRPTDWHLIWPELAEAEPSAVAIGEGAHV